MSSKSLTILLGFFEGGRQVLLVVYTTKRSILKSLNVIFILCLSAFISVNFTLYNLKFHYMLTNLSHISLLTILLL